MTTGSFTTCCSTCIAICLAISLRFSFAIKLFIISYYSKYTNFFKPGFYQMDTSSNNLMIVTLATKRGSPLSWFLSDCMWHISSIFVSTNLDGFVFDEGQIWDFVQFQIATSSRWWYQLLSPANLAFWLSEARLHSKNGVVNLGNRQSQLLSPNICNGDHTPWTRHGPSFAKSHWLRAIFMPTQITKWFAMIFLSLLWTKKHRPADLAIFNI